MKKIFTFFLLFFLSVYSSFEHKDRRFESNANFFNQSVNMIIFSLMNNPGDEQEARNLVNSGNLAGLFEVFNCSPNSPRGDVAVISLSFTDIYIAKIHNGSTKTFSDFKKSSFKDFMRDSCLLIHPGANIPIHPGGSLY